MSAAANMDYALDASALLAVLLDEPGQDRVRAVLDRAFIHTVNIAEVIKKLLEKGVPLEEARAAVDELHLGIQEEFRFDQAVGCGILLAETREYGFGLGDCICLTAAADAGATAVTAERLWQRLSGQSIQGRLIRIELIR